MIRHLVLALSLSILSACASLQIDRTKPGYSALDKASAHTPNLGLEERIELTKIALLTFENRKDLYGAASAKLLLGQFIQLKEAQQAIHAMNSKSYPFLTGSKATFDQIDRNAEAAYASYLLADLYYRAQSPDKACQEYQASMDFLDKSSDADIESFFRFDKLKHKSASQFVHSRFDYYCREYQNPGFAPEWYDENGRLKSFKRRYD